MGVTMKKGLSLILYSRINIFSAANVCATDKCSIGVFKCICLTAIPMLLLLYNCCLTPALDTTA